MFTKDLNNFQENRTKRCGNKLSFPPITSHIYLPAWFFGIDITKKIMRLIATASNIILIADLWNSWFQFYEKRLWNTSRSIENNQKLYTCSQNSRIIWYFIKLIINFKREQKSARVFFSSAPQGNQSVTHCLFPWAHKFNLKWTNEVGVPKIDPKL